MAVLAGAGTHRAKVLERLALAPDLTAGELAHVIGARSNSLTQLLAAMQYRAEVVCRAEWRPQQGRRVRLWSLAPPGTVPPPRPAISPERAARIRERDRLSQRARRARKRPPVPEPVTASLTGAACRSSDPALFFPEPGDQAAEAAAVAICAGCPVRAACYAGAAARGERWGIWGGKNFEAARWPVHKAGGCLPGGRPSRP
jgi:hypothetical protein